MTETLKMYIALGGITVILAIPCYIAYLNGFLTNIVDGKDYDEEED